MTTAEPGNGSTTTALDLTDGVPSLAAVRRWAGAALDDLPDDVLEDVLLVLTELVSNAFDHGEHPRRVRLRRRAVPCSVRVEVYDGAFSPPVVGRSRLGEHRGRGLVIVDRLSTAWGVLDHQAGKTVWADIDGTPPPDTVHTGHGT